MTPRMTRAALRKLGVTLVPVVNTTGARAVANALTTLDVAKGSPRKPKMNKTEAAYGVVLEARKRSGEIRDYWFEGITFKLADDVRYTPDYFVLMADWSCECHEVKGFFRDDARVKVRVAARMYPFRFVVVRKDRAGFHLEEVPA